MTNGGNESSFFLALRKKSSSVLEPNSHMTVASGGGAMTGYIHRLPIKDHKDYVAITPQTICNAWRACYTPLRERNGYALQIPTLLPVCNIGSTHTGSKYSNITYLTRN